MTIRKIVISLRDTAGKLCLAGTVGMGGACWATVPGTRDYQVELVKFIVPNKEETGSKSLPIFLAAPDTLCGLPVRKTLFATDAQRDSLISAHLDRKCFDRHPEYAEFINAIQSLLKFQVQKGIESLRRLDGMSKDTALDYCVKLNWAVFQYLMGQEEWIERDLKKILGRYPGATEREGAWKNLFSIYFSRKKYVEADSLVEEILKLQPKTLWAQQYKIHLIQMLGNRSDLRDYLKQKSSWRDSMFAIQVAYGLLLKESGEMEGAVRYLTRGLEGDPNNGEGWLQLAEIYYQEGRFSFVNQCLHFAVRAGTHNPLYFEMLAGVVEQQFRFMLVRKKLLEKDIQKCYYARNMGECKAHYEKIIRRDVDSGLIQLREVLENSVLQRPQSRIVAQKLASVYGALGDGEARQNFMDQFWFHFQSPYPFSRDLGPVWSPLYHRLNIPWTPEASRYAAGFFRNDWFEF